MKRLSLAAFKAQKSALQNSDQLLGQVLGNCHDRKAVPELTQNDPNEEDG